MDSSAVTPQVAGLSRALTSLIDQSHLVAPHELPELISRHAAEQGVSEATIYLADLQQTVLVAFLPPQGLPSAHVA